MRWTYYSCKEWGWNSRREKRGVISGLSTPILNGLFFPAKSVYTLPIPPRNHPAYPQNPENLMTTLNRPGVVYTPDTYALPITGADSKVYYPSLPKCDLNDVLMITIPKSVMGGQPVFLNFVDSPIGKATASLAGLFMRIVQQIRYWEAKKTGQVPNVDPLGEKIGMGKDGFVLNGEKKPKKKKKDYADDADAATDDDNEEDEDERMGGQEGTVMTDSELKDLFGEGDGMSATDTLGGGSTSMRGSRGGGSARVTRVDAASCGPAELFVEALMKDPKARPVEITGYRLICVLSNGLVVAKHKAIANFVEDLIQRNMRMALKESKEIMIYNRLQQAHGQFGIRPSTELSKSPSQTISDKTTLRENINLHLFGSEIGVATLESIIDTMPLTASTIMNPLVLFHPKVAFREIQNVCADQLNMSAYMQGSNIYFPHGATRLPNNFFSETAAMQVRLPWTVINSNRTSKAMRQALLQYSGRGDLVATISDDECSDDEDFCSNVENKEAAKEIQDAFAAMIERGQRLVEGCDRTKAVSAIQKDFERRERRKQDGRVPMYSKEAEAGFAALDKPKTAAEFLDIARASSDPAAALREAGVASEMQISRLSTKIRSPGTGGTVTPTTRSIRAQYDLGLAKAATTKHAPTSMMQSPTPLNFPQAAEFIAGRAKTLARKSSTMPGYMSHRIVRKENAQLIWSLATNPQVVPHASSVVTSHLAQSAHINMFPEGEGIRPLETGALLPVTSIHDSNLSPFGNMINRLLGKFEDILLCHNSHFTLLLVMLASHASWWYSWSLHPNILMAGPEDVSKSWIIERQQEMMLTGTYRKQQMMTSKADTAAKDDSGSTEFWSEISPTFLGIDAKNVAAARARGQAAPPIDLSERGAQTKERLTSMQVAVTYCKHINNNGQDQRVSFTVTYYCIASIIGATNDGVDALAPPMKSRFIVVSVLSMERYDKKARSSRPPDVVEKTNFTTEMKNMQALIAYTFMQLRAGEHGGDVNTNVLEVYYPRFEEFLREEGVNVTGNRVRTNVLTIARVLTVMYANYIFWQCDEARMMAGKCWDPIAMSELGPLLMVTDEIAVFAMTLVGFHAYARQDLYDVVLAIREEFFPNEKTVGQNYYYENFYVYNFDLLRVPGSETREDDLVNIIYYRLQNSKGLTLAQTQIRTVLQDLKRMSIPVGANLYQKRPPVQIPENGKIYQLSDFDPQTHIPLREEVQDSLKGLRDHGARAEAEREAKKRRQQAKEEMNASSKERDPVAVYEKSKNTVHAMFSGRSIARAEEKTENIFGGDEEEEGGYAPVQQAEGAYVDIRTEENEEITRVDEQERADKLKRIVRVFTVKQLPQKQGWQITFATDYIMGVPEPRKLMRRVMQKTLQCPEQKPGKLMLLGFSIAPDIPNVPDFFITEECDKRSTPSLRGPNSTSRDTILYEEQRIMKQGVQELDAVGERYIKTERINADTLNELTALQQKLANMQLNLEEARAAMFSTNCSEKIDTTTICYAGIGVEEATFTQMIIDVDFYCLHDADNKDNNTAKLIQRPNGLPPALKVVNGALETECRVAKEILGQFQESERKRVHPVSDLFSANLDVRVKKNGPPKELLKRFPGSYLPKSLEREDINTEDIPSKTKIRALYHSERATIQSLAIISNPEAALKFQKERDERLSKNTNLLSQITTFKRGLKRVRSTGTVVSGEASNGGVSLAGSEGDTNPPTLAGESPRKLVARGSTIDPNRAPEKPLYTQTKFNYDEEETDGNSLLFEVDDVPTILTTSASKARAPPQHGGNVFSLSGQQKHRMLAHGPLPVQHNIFTSDVV